MSERNELVAARARCLLGGVDAGADLREAWDAAGEPWIGDVELLEKYAALLVERILSDPADRRALACELGDLWRASDYRSGLLSLWYEIGQAVALVEAGEGGTYDGVDEESLDDAIHREAELHREFTGIAVPADLVHVRLCGGCGHLDRPVVERSRRVFRPPPSRFSCARCGCRDLTGTHDHAGRRALLDHLRGVSGGELSGA